MASFYELSEEERDIIVESLVFQRYRTWGEILECTVEELDALIAYMKTRERR